MTDRRSNTLNTTSVLYVSSFVTQRQRLLTMCMWLTEYLLNGRLLIFTFGLLSPLHCLGIMLFISFTQARPCSKTRDSQSHPHVVVHRDTETVTNTSSSPQQQALHQKQNHWGCHPCIKLLRTRKFPQR